MTDEERLEEIKNNDISYLLYGTKLKDYWEWLIEQAERVIGTEQKLGLADMYADCNREVARLNYKVQRYREALETIKMVTEFKSEANEIANKALEGEE